ncbi:hypothetical protein OUZ56_011523 [Daphnia magna]|uniref:Uncharacterized protein n=1 Tax=Daphnia magna TaxID=35525 RepID=A0ABQ9Z1N1_9CRUS|nr:hypothetical protein OUZ56_011523 [Daphnia magna]
MNEPVPERQILNKILAALPPNFRVNETPSAFRAYNHSSIRRSRGGHQAGRGGYPGLRGNLQNVRRGAANRYNTAYHHNQRERSKLHNQEFECDLCEVDTHKTADCRKLARARAILKASKEDNFPNMKNQDPSISDQEMYEEQSNTAKSSHNQDSAFCVAV